MAYDPHHDSIIEDLKEIFARYSELEDRLEFLVNELEAHADFSDHATGGWREMANILDGYCVEFGGGKARVPNVVRVQGGKVVNSYKHLQQYCTIYQEGGIACEDCYDFICDACGEHKEGEPEEVVNTETLCGVVMCRDCHTSKDFDTKCTNDACPVCGGNTQERVEEQIARLERLEKLAEGKE